MSTALIVVESMFGNTSAVAQAVAEGLRQHGVEVNVVPAGEAQTTPDAPLVIVGAPTHNLGLPSPASRAKAGTGVERGVREWLATARLAPGTRVAAFDTQLPGPFSGSAAKKIEASLRRLRTDVVGRESYIVQGAPPQLRAGELDRARAWGAALA